MVPKRLKSNKKLHNTLRAGMTFRDNNGLKNMLLPMDGSSVTELFKYVARGLAWFHWNTIIEKNTVISKSDYFV